MSSRTLLVYCDESIERGPFYSNFYGGALIDESDRLLIDRALNETKANLNLNGELKWTKITENYADKYIKFIDHYFDIVQSNKIKVRIMFTHNYIAARGLSDEQIGNRYYLLYYQFLKHSFGLQFCNPDLYDEIKVILHLDDLPDKKNLEAFKDYICSLSKYPVFRDAKITLQRQDIAEVRSHDHAVLQGLDIILGSMQFRLNDMHKVKPEGRSRRSKRTIAKERVFNHISRRIRGLYPNFNMEYQPGKRMGLLIVGIIHIDIGNLYQSTISSTRNMRNNSRPHLALHKCH